MSCEGLSRLLHLSCSVASASTRRATSASSLCVIGRFHERRRCSAAISNGGESTSHGNYVHLTCRLCADRMHGK